MTSFGPTAFAFRGRLIATVGNRAALQQRQRYLSRDLNREWEPSQVTAIRTAPIGHLTDEDREQRELLELFAPYLEEARRPVVFLDLHSTSGPGAPFVCMADVIRNRPSAFDLKIPVVLGLEETIQGSMLGYLCDLGHVGVAVEGGQHDHPDTIEHHQAAIWSVLATNGAVSRADIPSFERLHTKMLDAVKGLPSVTEIRHRHVCTDDDGFEMMPNYRNFQPLRAGEHVANDRGGAIVAPENGLMMLPRYQGQGEDGYFIARPVGAFWLSLSAQLRRASGGTGSCAAYPAYRDIRIVPDHFRVDQRIARYRVVDVFHLLG